MKSMLITLFFFASTSAHALTASDCSAQLDAAQSKLELVQDQFEVGEVTKVDVAFAQMDVLNVELSCKTISLASYCGKAPQLAAFLVNGTEEEAKHTGNKEAVGNARYIQDVVYFTCH